MLMLFLILSACSEGTGSDEYENDSCSSCWVSEDYYGNAVLVCSENVPLGVTCYGGLRQFQEPQ